METATQTTTEWIALSERLSPDGVLVMTKIDDEKGVRNEQSLVRRGSLWFTSDSPDAMYVYYAPTHWKPLASASQETPAQERWIKVAHILHMSAHCNLSWDTCKLLAQRIAKECIANRDPAFQKLVKTLDDLCGFLNVTPLRLNEGDSMTLSMLTDSAREALRLAREGEE